jgi:hypothetical protein
MPWIAAPSLTPDYQNITNTTSTTFRITGADLYAPFTLPEDRFAVV